MRAQTARLQKRLKSAEVKLRRIARNAVNDAAREVAAGTPDYLQRTLDQPTKLTTSKGVARVAPGSTSDPRARIFVARKQAEYLSRIEHGATHEDHNAPVGRKASDQRGNVKAAFRRRGDGLKRLLDKTIVVRGGGKVRRYFIGRPHGRSQAGIWERTRGNRSLELVSAFIRKARYRPGLNLRQEWQSKAKPALRRQITIQRAHSANKM